MAISCHLAETNRERVGDDTIKCHSAQLPKRGRAKFRGGLVPRHAVVAIEIGENLPILLAQLVTRPPGGGADAVARRPVQHFHQREPPRPEQRAAVIGVEEIEPRTFAKRTYDKKRHSQASGAEPRNLGLDRYIDGPPSSLNDG